MVLISVESPTWLKLAFQILIHNVVMTFELFLSATQLIVTGGAINLFSGFSIPLSTTTTIRFLMEILCDYCT